MVPTVAVSCHDQFPLGIGASFGHLLNWSTFALFNTVGLFAFRLLLSFGRAPGPAGPRGFGSQFPQSFFVSHVGTVVQGVIFRTFAPFKIVRRSWSVEPWISLAADTTRCSSLL